MNLVPRSPHKLLRRSRLIVTEQGATSFVQFVAADETDDTVIVAQGLDEAPVTLPFRVRGRLALLERSGSAVDRAFVLVGPESGGETRAARELVVRAVLAHVATADAGEIVLVAPDHADLRRELVELVERLLGENEAVRVTLRLRFQSNELPPASRVRLAVPPRAPSALAS